MHPILWYVLSAKRYLLEPDGPPIDQGSYFRRNATEIETPAVMVP